MTTTHCLRLSTLGGLILGACAEVGPEPSELRAQAVVYGADSRRDFYQLPPDAPLRSLARAQRGGGHPA